MELNYELAEAAVVHGVLWLKLAVELVGATVIGVGVVVAIHAWLQGVRQSSDLAFAQARLSLARYLSLALELQLGADILSTAVAPSWDQIGKLAAIAVIRTALNYFLGRELQKEEAEPVVHEPKRA